MLTTLALALAAQPQLAFELKWEPKQGETHVYELFLKDKSTSVEASVEHRVTSVAKDGSYKVRSRSLGAFVRVGAEEIRDDRPNEATASFDASGRLQEITGGTAGLAKYRSALLTRFVAPPVARDVGYAWTYERAADNPEGLAACKIDYKFAKWDTATNTAEVRFTFAEIGGEHPQSATGTWWIEGRDRGWLPVKMEAKVKNFGGAENSETEVRLVLRRPAR